MLIDTHCHLQSRRLHRHLTNVLAQARKVGVQDMVIPCLTIADFQICQQIAEFDSQVWIAVGVHPSQSLSPNIDLKPAIQSQLKHHRVVAIGEVGLDNQYFDQISLDQQLSRLVTFISLAIKHQKALIIHNRGCTLELLNLFSSMWSEVLAYRVVFHCCEADDRLLDFAKQNHIYLGIDGDITYDHQKIDFVQSVPLDNIVLETDAPFLLPEPLRSQKHYPNKPENLPLVASQLAKIKHRAVSQVHQITTQNAKRLFAI